MRSLGQENTYEENTWHDNLALKLGYSSIVANWHKYLNHIWHRALVAEFIRGNHGKEM